MADNLLDKASILLTPTAYNDGSMLSVKPENGDGDFTFSRSSAATRVNAQGLVENVQIISSELVSNGNFSQIGTEEVSNGNFSQEGSELVTNGDFATDSDWTLTQATISNGSASFATTDGSFAGIRQTVFSVGKTYLISLDVSNLVGTIEVNTNGGLSIGLDITTNGTKSFYMKAESVDIEIKRKFGAEQVISATIDNVSVKEVGQDWAFGGGASLTSLGAKITHSPTAGSITQLSVLDVGKQYKITYEITESVAGGLKINSAVDSSMVTTAGSHTKYFEADLTSLSISRTDASNNDVTITNISVKEVGQDWLFQNGWNMGDGVAVYSGTVSAYRTIYQENVLTVNSKYRLTFDIVSISSGSIENISQSSPTSYSTVGTKTEDFIATSTDLFLKPTTDADLTIDNVSIKEITDDTDLPRINYEGFSYQDSLGSEEVVNGDFATDSNWNKNSNWSISGNTANCDGTSNGDINQGTTLATSGKSYRITFDIVSISQGEFFFKFGGVNGTFRNSIGTYTETIQAINSNRISLDSLNNAIGSIDNVSVKEVLGQEVVPDSGCGSWLLEPQSTNLIQYSEDFTEWTNTRSSDLSGFISPMGENNATKFISDTTASNSHIIKSTNITISSGQKYTYSVFVKANQLNYVRLVFTDSTVSKFLSVYFNLASETVGTTSDGSTATLDSSNIENFGNGWFRCSVSGDLDTTTTAHARIYLADEDNSSSFNGDGSSGLYIWGAQLEEQSYATSYIPTEGAIRTRLADEATNSGNSTLINSTEGVLYVEIAALADDGTNRIISLFEDGNINNRVNMFYTSGSNKMKFVVRINGSNVFDNTITLSNILNYNKVALKYKENDFGIYINGVKEVEQLSGSTYPSNTLDKLNFNQGSGSFPFHGKTKALAVYKEALTDAELQSLTTI